MIITGKCLCGAVRFSAVEPPIAARVCWCRDCQKFGAGSGTVNVMFKTAGFTVDGALGDYVSTADSGNVMHRRFCSVCGTPMFSEAEVRPNVIMVRAGLLDDPELIKPTATIWTASAPSWAAIDPHLEQFEGQPPPVA
jgi:hypothetical protein